MTRLPKGGRASGLALLLSDGQPKPGMPSIVTTIGGSDVAGIPVFCGAFIFTVINTGLNLLNVSIYWQLIAIGIIIVLAVELDVVRRRLEERFRTMQAGR